MTDKVPAMLEGDRNDRPTLTGAGVDAPAEEEVVPVYQKDGMHSDAEDQGQDIDLGYDEDEVADAPLDEDEEIEPRAPPVRSLPDDLLDLDGKSFIKHFNDMRGRVFQRFGIQIREDDEMLLILCFMSETIIMDDQRRTNEIAKSLESICDDMKERMRGEKDKCVDHVKSVTANDFFDLREKLSGLFTKTLEEHQAVFDKHEEQLEKLKRGLESPAAWRAATLIGIGVMLMVNTAMLLFLLYAG